MSPAQENALQPGPIEEVVYCHDPQLGIVQRMLVGDCDGEAVSAERAEQIRAEAIERRRRALETPSGPVVENRKLRSIGTGFFVAADGRLLTNNHVVDGCLALSVAMPDGRTFGAELLDTEPRNDLALVAAPVEAPDIARFLNGPMPGPGDAITLIGYPDQGLAPIKPLLTEGELGGSHLMPHGRWQFQIKADVRRGNSGGPVADLGARVIGVVVAKIDTVSVFERTGRNIRFVGIAIENAAVFEFLDRNHVDYRFSGGFRKLSATELESRLRPIVARIECWQ